MEQSYKHMRDKGRQLKKDYLEEGKAHAGKVLWKYSSFDFLISSFVLY